MTIFLVIVFQFFAAAVLAVFINLFGKTSRKLGYVNLSDIQAEGLLGYNLIFRVLAPAVYIAFLSILLYFVGFEELIRGIWLISLWYALLSIFILISLGRFPLINKLLYFSIQGAAIVIAYFLYKVSFSHGLQAILPDASNFRTELWVILLIFFYSILNSYDSNPSSYYERKGKYIKELYALLTKCYKKILSDEIKTNSFLEKLFFSIMIVEVINRNRFLRFIERLLHPLGLIKTTGIMQIKSDKSLSDEESIQLAQIKIQNSYHRHENLVETNYDLARGIINDYNGSHSYFDAVTSTFHAIDTNNLLYASRTSSTHKTSKDMAKEMSGQSVAKVEAEITNLISQLKILHSQLKEIDPEFAGKIINILSK